MTTINILNKAIRTNADLIYVIECGIIEARSYARMHKTDGETAFMVEQYDNVAKLKRKLKKQVEMQKVFKVEIMACLRMARIKRKYLKVFGQLPHAPLYTTYEQEAMLDALLKEKAEAEKVKAPATA
jgi:hypothetical protein